MVKSFEEREFELTEICLERNQMKETLEELKIQFSLKEIQIKTMEKVFEEQNKKLQKELEEEKNKVEELNILNEDIEINLNKVQKERIELVSENVKLNAKV